MLYFMLRFVGAVPAAPKLAPKHRAEKHKHHRWDEGKATLTGWAIYKCLDCGYTDIG